MHMEQFCKGQRLVQKIVAALVQTNAPQEVMVDPGNQPKEVANRLQTIDIAKEQVVTIVKQDNATRPGQENFGHSLRADSSRESKQLGQIFHQRFGRGHFLCKGLMGNRLVYKKMPPYHV